MNVSNNFNYPGLNNIDVDVVVDPVAPLQPGGIRYVTMTDDFSTWRTIPKKTLPNPFGSGYVTVVPYVPKATPLSNTYFQRRQLYINPIGGGQENVPLPVVSGKNWYLDSISFRAYDMHEQVPNWYPLQLVEDIGATNTTDLYIADAFGTGFTGVVVGYNTDDEVTWKLSPYTTASYPDFQFDNLDKIYNPGFADSSPLVGVGKYGQNYSTFDSLNQAGSRSGVVGGMLASDFFPNQFSFNISGSTSSTGIITGTGDMIFGSDMFTTYRNGTGDWTHTSLPLQLSNMNIQVNYPYIGCEIYGAGYYQYLYWGENPSQADNSIKGITTTAITPRTITQFPIIAELILVQR
jgi:hypothetical protein